MPYSGMQSQKFLVEFEALRGLAAIVVLIHHFMLGFTPRLHGLLYPDQPFSLMGTPAFALINGSAAVVIFFVLSGFVLTVGLFKSRSLRGALISAVKRWPRLAVTVTIVNAVAGLFVAQQLFKTVEAAKVSSSVWFGWFYTWKNTGNSEILNAVSEGALTFFDGVAIYNSNLWTMYYEFWGSLIALGCAVACMQFREGFFTRLVLLAVWALCFCVSPYLSTFVVGVWLAQIYIARPSTPWSGWPVYAGAVLTILLLGYHENLISGRAEGFYSFLNPITTADQLRFRVVLHTIAAALIMSAFLRVSRVKEMLSGGVGKALGFMSFPIYLAQILVICSVSSLVFVHLTAYPRSTQLTLTFSVTVIGTLLLALPIAYFDRWWVATLNTLTAHLSRRFFRSN